MMITYDEWRFSEEQQTFSAKPDELEQAAKAVLGAAAGQWINDFKKVKQYAFRERQRISTTPNPATAAPPGTTNWGTTTTVGGANPAPAQQW